MAEQRDSIECIYTYLSFPFVPTPSAQDGVPIAVCVNRIAHHHVRPREDIQRPLQ